MAVLRVGDGLVKGEATALDARAFRTRFPNINGALNWRWFERRGWPVERFTITDPEVLKSLRTVFRMRLGREPDRLRIFGGHFMTIEEAIGFLPRFKDPHHLRTITDYLERFRAAGEEVRLDLPAYRLAGGRHLVIDGNHRACALAMAEVPFRLSLYSIVGPWIGIPR